MSKLVLKKPVGSVREAHQELLPKNAKLKTGYQRQGEWFFNPVGDDLNMELMRSALHRSNCYKLHHKQEYTSHHAIQTRFGGKTYAIGKIYDNRSGRHQDLVLDRWHEVHHNNEAVVGAEKAKVWD